jgi:uncharacterized repeat protein (TIGR03803 family)
MKALSIVVLAGMVGCAVVQPAPAAEAVKFKEKILWSLGSGTDGMGPWAGLTRVGGKLYGTTVAGGSHDYGTVFLVDLKTGAETLLYSFCSQTSCADGDTPEAGLIEVNGLLYGTTALGGGTGCGGNGCGTVYSIDPNTGTEKVIYSFSGGTHHGAYPEADLIEVNGALYGTTIIGGIDSCLGFGCGTVFSLNPATGQEKVVYRFCKHANCTDGASPQASLIDVSGALYGTTLAGGPYCHGRYQDGCGTVFSLDPGTGTEKVLYSFCSQTNCADGAGPFAGLTEARGRLYGTTWEGGGEDEHGVVFSFDPGSGKEKLLYSFCSRQNCADGAYPYGLLIQANGALYGTTYGGGSGYGTAFAFDPQTGAETVLHTFSDGSDGAYPIAGLIDVKGTLYGTTLEGGTYGGGTVFAIEKR